jgi:hypothetical protein
MSELTSTYDPNRNGINDGYGNDETNGFGESSNEIQQPARYRSDESTEKPRGRIREKESNDVGPEQEEEPETSVLNFPKSKIKKSKTIPFSEYSLNQKINNFKKIKKEKYRTRIKKEKEKHMKWKARSRTYRQQIANYKTFQEQNQQQPREAVVHMMDSFGRVIKN